MAELLPADQAVLTDEELTERSAASSATLLAEPPSSPALESADDAEPDLSGVGPEEPPKAGTAPARPGVHLVRFVDMWAFPGLHLTNIDLLQRLKSADDRQFGTNMDVIGTVSDKNLETGAWTKTHLVGIRTDTWNIAAAEKERLLESRRRARQEQLRRQVRKFGRLTADDRAKLDALIAQDPTTRMTAADMDPDRLVLKMFKSTGKRLRWQASMEELTTREIQNSLGSHYPLIQFGCNLADHDHLIEVQQGHRTLRWPATFTIAYYDEESDRSYYLELKKYWLSFGADYAIEWAGRRVGLIDAQMIGLGTDAYLYLFDEGLAKMRPLVNLLTVFTATIGYHKKLWRQIKQRLHRHADPTYCHLVDNEEYWLLKNPRRRGS